MKLRVYFGMKAFFLVFTLEFVNCKIFEMTTRIFGNFRTEDLFFLVFTLEFMKNRKIFERTTRICGNFQTEDLFFWSSPFSFDPHSRIYINKVLMPQKNLFIPPQSRYSGAGPVHYSRWKSMGKIKTHVKGHIINYQAEL